MQSGGLLNDEEAAEILQILTDDFTLVPRMARLEQQVAGLLQQVAAITVLVDRIAALPSIANQLKGELS